MSPQQLFFFFTRTVRVFAKKKKNLDIVTLGNFKFQKAQKLWCTQAWLCDIRVQVRTKLYYSKALLPSQLWVHCLEPCYKKHPSTCYSEWERATQVCACVYMDTYVTLGPQRPSLWDPTTNSGGERSADNEHIHIQHTCWARHMRLITIKPDSPHIRNVLRRQDPSGVWACGTGWPEENQNMQ